MFDADPFGALPEAAGEFSGEVAMGFAAEEAQHVWAFEMRRGVLDQGGIDRGERLGVAEHQVSGPFALLKMHPCSGLSVRAMASRPRFQPILS